MSTSIPPSIKKEPLIIEEHQKDADYGPRCSLCPLRFGYIKEVMRHINADHSLDEVCSLAIEVVEANWRAEKAQKHKVKKKEKKEDDD